MSSVFCITFPLLNINVGLSLYIYVEQYNIHSINVQTEILQYDNTFANDATNVDKGQMLTLKTVFLNISTH